MKKVSVSEAAEYFGVSKEAIHNRIRRGSLNVVVEDGIKMVLLDTTKAAQKTLKKTPTSRNPSNDERYYKLLQEQNEKLQARVESLESETRTLRDQKELMLIEEREKIEQIYKEKDEQFKSLLNTLSTQFMLTQKQEEPEALSVETIDAEIETSSAISLKKYLKPMKLSEKKIVKIKQRFKKAVQKEDERIVMIGSKYYIDPLKYDYSDLI